MNEGTARLKKIKCVNDPRSDYTVFVYHGNTGDSRTVRVSLSNNIPCSHTVIDKDITVLASRIGSPYIEFKDTIIYPETGLYNHELTSPSSVYCITNDRQHPIDILYDTTVTENKMCTSVYIFALGRGTINHFEINGVMLLKTYNMPVEVTGDLRIISFK